MRHKKSGRKLSRNSSHRKSLFKNLSLALVENKAIVTTLPKAKELRRYLEPLMTKAKIDTVANRRHVFAKLRHDKSVALLFTEIAERVKDRAGGYISILKYGYRKGDNAPLAYVRLIDFADDLLLRQQEKNKEIEEKEENA